MDNVFGIRKIITCAHCHHETPGNAPVARTRLRSSDHTQSTSNWSSGSYCGRNKNDFISKLKTKIKRKKLNYNDDSIKILTKN